MDSKIILFVFAFLLLNVTNQSFAQNEDKLVILDTKSGLIVIEFFTEDAPNHVDNFITLAESGFYEDTVFHRVIKDFMIQGGDPKTKPRAYDSVEEWGTGNPGYTIDAEFNNIKHNRGIVSMARSQPINSAGSQFFIVHNASNFLDGQYTVFGRIVTQESFETLDKIANLETAPVKDLPLKWDFARLLNATVVNRSEVPDLLDLGEPERTTSTSLPTLSSDYSNEELGFSATFPDGWMVQEPQKTSASVPDVAAVGPQTDDFPPTVTVTVIDSNGKSIDERIVEGKKALEPVIESGQLEIMSEEKTTINGNDAFTIATNGSFQTSAGSTNVMFKETTILSSEKFYIITFASSKNNFDTFLPDYEKTLNSFETLPKESESNGNTITRDMEETISTDLSSPGGENGGGCLIATATFGTELAPQVQKLRETRDNTLLSTASGTSFMIGFNQFYYSFSPAIADLERENKIFKEIVKLAITPLLTSLSILNYVDIDSEEEMLGYGIGIILLNLGMYFVAPAIFIHGIRKITPQNYFSLRAKSSEI